jgi:hypothetical protein
MPLLACALLCLALPGGGQNPTAPMQVTTNGQPSAQPMRGSIQDMDQPFASGDSDPAMQEARLKQLNAAQHKSMVADAGKLLKLVTELNAEIGSSNPGSLNADELRKLAEIEKLARSVKDKMRISVKGTPAFQYPLELPHSLRP